MSSDGSHYTFFSGTQILAGATVHFSLETKHGGGHCTLQGSHNWAEAPDEKDHGSEEQQIEIEV